VQRLLTANTCSARNVAKEVRPCLRVQRRPSCRSARGCSHERPPGGLRVNGAYGGNCSDAARAAVLSGVGVQWELRGAAVRRDQSHALGFFPIPVRTRAFCRYGGLGSSNRPFPRRRPRSNGSAREPPRPDPARGGETPIQPHRVYPPEGRSSSLESVEARRADVSERGGQGLPGFGGRATPLEPTRPNRHGMRSLPRPNLSSRPKRMLPVLVRKAA
jgi:hypothetical protein